MADRTLFILTGFLLFVTPAGTYLMIDAQTRTVYNGFTPLFIGLQFSVVMLLFYKNFGLLNLLYLPAIFAMVMIVEITGASTGFPFGNYYYSEILQPQIFNAPVAVGLSWIMTSLTSLFIVRTFAPGNSILNVFSASALLTAYDLVLEPFAAHVNRFWVWEKGSVPIENYIAWFGVSFVITAVLNYIPRKNELNESAGRITSAVSFLLLGINIFQFGTVNIFTGYTWQSIAGLTFIAAIILINKFRGAELAADKRIINV
ncbi:MAG TPA: carotenoid biosynthesis protein [Ignavibacteria bacterium]|nr:carotenoid biosynthesis protein [Ignavibacteria bacterium]